MVIDGASEPAPESSTNKDRVALGGAWGPTGW